ncbi:uncharacterized protein LOC112599486 [Melanaphis sacchari]|uniref:uncharacterized protein LOC112599486 n=1 Tax=Melanaphis sacchari TaxID=742174 RepID=UPI000DC138C4|nr:uncharacterized protein LOC112599486 [Melanaphis sacchari]
MVTMKVFVLITFFSLSYSITNFMPNLPVGKYHIVFEKMYSCNSTNLFQFNIYTNKKASNITEMKGNITSLSLLDDTYILEFNMASWSSIGGWKPNAVVYINNKACSAGKNLLGNAWYLLMDSFKVPTTSCPLPPGKYTTTGIDMQKIEDNNFPKLFFYGKYKATIKIKTINKKVVGCGIIELSFLRPWEKPI